MSTIAPAAATAQLLAPDPYLVPLLPQLFLPPGQLSLLIGDPGVGKSLLAIDIAARMSQAQPMPPITPSLDSDLANSRSTPFNDEPSTMNNYSTSSPTSDPSPLAPASVLIISFEDSTETLTFRYLCAGGHEKHIDFLSPRARLLDAPEFDPLFDEEQPETYLLKHLAKLCKKMSPAPRLFIIDPLPAFLGTADSYSATLVRDRLAPFLNFAREHKLSILGITHLAKPTGKNKNPLHRIIGSLAYPALARAVYHVVADPRDPQARLVVPLKHNLAPLSHSFPFTIAPGKEPTGPLSYPTLNWNTPIPYNPTDALGEERDSIAQSQLEFACDFLITILQDGPINSADLHRQARANAIPPATLSRAKYRLGVKSLYRKESRNWQFALRGTIAAPTPPVPPHGDNV